MAAWAIGSWRAALAGRWAARILGTLVFLLYLAFIFGEGLPLSSHLTAREKLQFLGVAGLILGLPLAWKWEGAGGLLSLAGFALLAILSRGYVGLWPFRFPAAIGLLHVLCWERLRVAAPAGLGPWRLPRGVTVSVLAALGVFLLLCANEIFGLPPLMTPTLVPPPAMWGTWQSAQPMSMALTIHPDATVTGRIGQSSLVGGRILYNRSWFGVLLHLRSACLIRGALANDERFTIPLDPRGDTFDGALFLGGQPMRVQLRKP